MILTIIISLSITAAVIAMYLLVSKKQKIKGTGGTGGTVPVGPIIPIHNIPCITMSSSTYNGENRHNKFGRYANNTTTNTYFWMPATTDTAPWLQFNFPRKFYIESVLIKFDLINNYRLTEVDVYFSDDNDGLIWHPPTRVRISPTYEHDEYIHVIENKKATKIVRFSIVSGLSNNGVPSLAIPCKFGIFAREVKE